jgi:hypothetical protein
MSMMAVTKAQHVELLKLADKHDPPRKWNRIVGDPAAVARWLKRLVTKCSARPAPVGWTATPYTRDDKSGNVEITKEIAEEMAADPTCTAELKAKLQAVTAEQVLEALP